MDQSAPCQTRQDVGSEIVVRQRSKQHQPLPVAKCGELLAYRQRRFTPGYAERRITAGNRVAATPARRMDADDARVGSGLAELPYLQLQLLTRDAHAVSPLVSE